MACLCISWLSGVSPDPLSPDANQSWDQYFVSAFQFMNGFPFFQIWYWLRLGFDLMAWLSISWQVILALLRSFLNSTALLFIKRSIFVSEVVFISIPNAEELWNPHFISGFQLNLVRFLVYHILHTKALMNDAYF